MDGKYRKVIDAEIQDGQLMLLEREREKRAEDKPIYSARTEKN